NIFKVKHICWRSFPSSFGQKQKGAVASKLIADHFVATVMRISSSKKRKRFYYGLYARRPVVRVLRKRLFMLCKRTLHHKDSRQQWASALYTGKFTFTLREQFRKSADL
ncbi:hypothetical protein TNCV_2977361, partial [Trichonephila clavipes]